MPSFAVIYPGSAPLQAQAPHPFDTQGGGAEVSGRRKGRAAYGSNNIGGNDDRSSSSLVGCAQQSQLAPPPHTHTHTAQS